MWLWKLIPGFVKQAVLATIVAEVQSISADQLEAFKAELIKRLERLFGAAKKALAKAV
jgi:hypothetical protein